MPLFSSCLVLHVILIRQVSDLSYNTIFLEYVYLRYMNLQGTELQQNETNDNKTMYIY